MTPEEIQALVAKSVGETVSKAIAEHIPKALEPIAGKLNKIDAEHPGMMKRIAGEMFKELGGGAGGVGGAGGGKDDEKDPDKKSKAERLDKLEKENAAYLKAHTDLIDQLQREKDEKVVRSAIAKKKWVDAEEPVPELMRAIKRRADGSLMVATKKQIGNESIDAEITIDEAVDALAKRKPHWIEGFARGGTGATGAAGGGNTANIDDAENMSMDELERAGLIPKLIRDGKKDLVNRKARERLEKKHQSQPQRRADSPFKSA